ncbi:hypothetical protein [Asticcacaulis solisilvae]|uniref:hypothetical protein n=1 Tax=Asticcacaulis solisilvae TaxID=1217274 RepID=UPI003FD88932
MTDTETTPGAQDDTQGAGAEGAAEILIGGEHATGTGAPDGAPETYADFALPDGIAIDPAVAGDLKDLARALNLPQDQAQKIADLGARQAQRWADAQAKALNDASEAWVHATKSDAELGGDKLNEALAAGSRAMDAFGTPQLKSLLNETRLGNHPELVRFIARVGKAISDDTFVSGDRSAGTRGADMASRLYPGAG